jgi:biotin synthase
LTHRALVDTRTHVLEGGLPADRDLLNELARLPDAAVRDLLALADTVRERFCGNAVGVEVLYNAKRGGCSEDCHFCSQSARFATGVEPELLSTLEGFEQSARDAYARGAGEFCIVVAVRGPSEKLLDRICTAVRRIKAELPLKVAVSLGILRDEQVAALALAGVDKVNHNLETSRRYFPFVCTTHTFDERLETLALVRKHGLELCCGGIIGMGETMEDRIDFLVTLAELQPEETPSTSSIPVPGHRSRHARSSSRWRRCGS